MPYTIILDLSQGFANWLTGTFADVFDPAWLASVQTIVSKVCIPVRNDPYLLGYFSDNEVRMRVLSC